MRSPRSTSARRRPPPSGIAWLCAVVLWPGIAVAAGLAERLDAALAAPALRGAQVAALVVGAQGQVLYAREADRALIPASNQKVLTAVAALHTLGPTHHFVTEVFAPAEPDADGAVAALFVKGGGDPALTSEELWRLASDLRRAGVRRVQGDLVLDDSLFDGQRWHPSWGRTGARAYHAPVGALTANYGAFSVAVAAGDTVGTPVRSVVDPPIPYLALTNRARTGPRGRSSLVVDRRSGGETERVLVEGAIPRGTSKTYYRSVLDPTRYAGALLRLQLAAVGIEVTGQTKVGYVPATAVSLLAFEGRALTEVVSRFMKFSNNQMGESLVKTLGQRRSGSPGSWTSGMAAVRDALGELGLPLEGAVLRDGSGLSYENRVTPRLLVEALRAADRSFRFGPELEASLPIASLDGTLSDRADAAEGRVRAKTGLLTRVTGLSGYARRPDGERVVFSILVNGFRRGADAAMRGVDGFAAALVGP